MSRFTDFKQGIVRLPAVAADVSLRFLLEHCGFREGAPCTSLQFSEGYIHLASDPRLVVQVFNCPEYARQELIKLALECSRPSFDEMTDVLCKAGAYAQMSSVVNVHGRKMMFFKIPGGVVLRIEGV